MTCHVLHAGDGYTYLTDQVASDDSKRSPGQSLVDYYAVAGNPAGRWMGSGCAALGVAGVVSEEQMVALFGEGLHPDANHRIRALMDAGTSFTQARKAQQLGRKFYCFANDVPLVEALTAAYRGFEREHHRRATVQERRDIKTAVAARMLREQLPGHTPTRAEVRRYLTDQLGKARQPVSGFDLVFTPVKSVSLLWGLGSHDVRAIVQQVHEQAVRGALAYGEREAAFTRVGKNGVAQECTSGFVATAFFHRDSRVGDVDIHTHVAVANRVLGRDGIWRTVDGQQLFRVAVSMSETYNALVEQGLIERLGVRFVEVLKGPGKRAVREIAGMPVEWIKGFSRRRTQVEAGYEELLRDYVAEHGHAPPRSVQIKLADQAATGPDRPDKKQSKPLGEQVAQWRHQAQQLLPAASIEEVIAGCLHTPPGPDGTRVDPAELAREVIANVSETRATWTVYHVRAEAIRALKPFQFPTAEARDQAFQDVVDAALGAESIQLDITPAAVPTLLQRPDGESVFHRRGSTRYTSREILDAEARLVADTARCRGPVVSRLACATAIREFEQATGKTLNPGQRELVKHFASSGAALAVGIGPPGTGKSTAMRAVRQAWETTGGRVMGLAPSAAAASVLGDELNDNTGQRAPGAWVHADTLHSLVTSYLAGEDVDVRAGDMLLIDEAGMAGTLTLDVIREIAETHGAVVRLVGDHRQLPAVEAGGALRLIVRDVGGVELSEVRRFADPDEARAVLQLRVGDPEALRFYATRGRVTGGIRAAVLDQLYAAWQHDLAAGRTSIMISDSNEIARELSARAQTDRRARGLVAPTGVTLHDGTVAGVGDRVVTRLNRRNLRSTHAPGGRADRRALRAAGGHNWVKNGDLWTVHRVYADGRLRVKHVRDGATVTLPASYVADYVELGYAASIHRSQGLTVDVSHSFLTARATREAALVALSRGIHGNRAYFDVEQVLDPDEPYTLPGDLFYRNRETATAMQLFGRILQREGAEPSATEVLREALDEPYRFDVAVPQYTHALHLWRGPQAVEEARNWVRVALPGHADDILTDDAWPALQAVLHEARDAGANPMALLAGSAGRGELDTAESVAKVLHYRIVRALPMPEPGTTDRPALLPGWVPSPPPAATPGGSDERELAQWIRDRAGELTDRVRHLGEQLTTARPDWANQLGPVPTARQARARWVACAGHIAAYRECFAIPENVADALPPHTWGVQGRARAWVAEYVRRHLLRDERATESRWERAAERATRLRTRLAALATRIDQQAATSDPAPHTPAPDSQREPEIDQ